MVTSEAEESTHSALPTSVAPGRFIAGGVLGCCLAAVLFAFVFDRYFVLTADLAEMPSGEQLAIYNAARYSFNLQKAAAQIATLGLLLGVFLGAVGLRHAAATLLAGGLGALFGAVGGSLSAMCVAWFETYRDESPVVLGVPIDPLLQGVIIQAASWCLVGGAVGFGLYVAYDGLKRGAAAIVGGLLGGVVAAIVYVILSSLPPFSNSNNLRTVPESPLEIFVWAAISGIALAGCLYLSVQPKKNAALGSV